MASDSNEREDMERRERGVIQMEYWSVKTVRNRNCKRCSWGYG